MNPGRPPRLTDPPNRIVTVLLGYCVVAGLLYLARLSTPRSIEQTLPPALRVAWALGLIVGGTAALAGQYWLGRPFTGARLKRGGLIVAGGGLLAWGTALLIANSFEAGGLSGLVSLVFGAAFLDRAHQVGGLLRQAEAHVEANRDGVDRGGDGGRGAVG